MGRVRRMVVLAARPVGMPVPGDFRMEEEPLPAPRAGEAVLRTLWLSVDPYQRRMMDAPQLGRRGVALGEPLPADLVSRVVESRRPGLRPGDVVLHPGAWADGTLSDGTGLHALDPALAPVSTALGVLGMTGMTAWVGIDLIARPRPGETLVVGAAAGAVGSVVGQVARLRGARVVGVAGGPEKCRHLREELGFDAALDHREPDLAGRLERACPDGIDVYWENVGGALLRAALPLLNDGARVPVCGRIAHYNEAAPDPGDEGMGRLMDLVLSRSLRVEGFLVDDHAHRRGAFLREMGAWLREGRVVHREDVAEGLERAPERLVAVLRGETRGKALVRVAPG